MAPGGAEPHAADRAALAEWHYPSDAQFRRFQFDAVLASLRANALVSFPTGLGKTLVAAVAMHNFLRWFPASLVVFVAPTRPLVAQQLDAVLAAVPIGRDGACLLTGDVPPAERGALYAQRRALFTTAQVLANDLLSGACPAARISLLVLDEAHHAQGDHACARGFSWGEGWLGGWARVSGARVVARSQCPRRSCDASAAAAARAHKQRKERNSDPSVPVPTPPQHRPRGRFQIHALSRQKSPRALTATACWCAGSSPSRAPSACSRSPRRRAKTWRPCSEPH